MLKRVLIVDDHKMFRIGLRAILDAEADLRVVAEAGSAHEAYAAIAASLPDIALLDLTLRGESGMSVLRELAHHAPRCKVVILSVHDDVDVVCRALDAGAAGYLLKDQEPRDLVGALRSVSHGEQYVAPAIAPKVTEFREACSVGHSAEASGLDRLSRRETVVFELLARGYDNAAIARELFISPKTVATHRSHILKKLGVHSLAALVRLAARHGRLVA